MDFQGFSFERVLYQLLISAAAWAVIYYIRDRWTSFMSRKCRSGHKKKYLRFERWTNIDCKKHSRHNSNDEWWSTWALWMCEEPGCNATGEDCFGTKGEWKIEFGKMVLDEKALSNDRQYEKGPKAFVERKMAAQQGLPKAVTWEDGVRALEKFAIQVEKGSIMFIPIEKPAPLPPSTPISQAQTKSETPATAPPKEVQVADLGPPKKNYTRANDYLI